MESGLLDTHTWTGSVGARLGGKLYVNLINDDEGFEAGTTHLASEIASVLGSSTSFTGARPAFDSGAMPAPGAAVQSAPAPTQYLHLAVQPAPFVAGHSSGRLQSASRLGELEESLLAQGAAWLDSGRHMVGLSDGASPALAALVGQRETQTRVLAYTHPLSPQLNYCPPSGN